jgi:serine/threonine protein kinase
MCIKTLNKAMIKDARRGRRVHQEVFALKTLRHPNVIVLYDVIHTKEHVHIITERLEKVRGPGTSPILLVVFFRIKDAEEHQCGHLP